MSWQPPRPERVLARALHMANERAERWQQRTNDARNELAALKTALRESCERLEGSDNPSVAAIQFHGAVRALAADQPRYIRNRHGEDCA